MAIKPAEMLEETMVPKPCPIVEGLVPGTPEAFLAEGGVACGKTQALVERVVALVSGGVDPADILVFCATPDACAVFRRRMGAVCAAASDVRVATPREWCLEALADKPGKAVGQKRVRLLAPFETDVLMEDLKTGGVRPKRLKEMLKFFYKSMTELCDWDEEWLLTGEEIMTYSLLRECLDFEGAVLEPELANACARWFHDDEGACSAHAVGHVLVDDYQMLSRASQVLANEIAHESIAIAANPVAVAEVFESYPYGPGVEEFLVANPTAQKVVLAASHACDQAVHAVGGIAADPLVACEAVEGAREGACAQVLHAPDPAGEKDLVAKLVSRALVEGMRPADVVVAVPNGVWGRNVVATLELAGIPTTEIPNPKSVSGDLRDLDCCTAARVLTALYLLADPGDGVAWRSWCGFGNLFACGSAVKDIRAAAMSDKIGAAEAFSTFESADMGDVNRAEWESVRLAQAQADELLAEGRGKTGEELLAYVAEKVCGEGAEVPAAIRALVAPFEDGRLVGEDAAAMAARARSRIDAPRVERLEAVRVVLLADVTGTTPRALVMCGLVDGFFPWKGVVDPELLVQQDADKQKAKDLRLLMNAAGKPLDELWVTVFDEIPLEMAERMKMKIRRVQLHDGGRVALSQPSIYIRNICG